MFFLGLVSNERVQPAPSMGPGIWQLPGDASGLQHDWAQRAGGNWRAGGPNVSRTPGKLAPRTPSGVLLGQPLAFVLYTKPTLLSSFGSGSTPVLGSRTRTPGGAPGARSGFPSLRCRRLGGLTLSLQGTEQGHCASEGVVLAPDEAHIPHVWWVLGKVCRVTHGVSGDAGET